MAKILLVEDDADIVENLSALLSAEGFTVKSAGTQQQAVDLLSGERFDLALLDISLPDGSGYAVCSVIKADTEDNLNRDVPVVFITAYDDEASAVASLDMGADDYISKPFSIREVMVRIMAVLRRTSVAVHAEASQAHVLEYQSLVLNTDNKKVSVDGREIAFTRIEYELLELLLKERGHVFSRADLIQQVWPSDVLVLDRTVDVNMARIRKKIGRYASNIVTRQGFGYYFEE